MTNSLVLITNTENQIFGTGFIVYKKQGDCYIVTCSHVVEKTALSLLVDSVEAEVLYIGSSDGIDLAVLKATIKKEVFTMLESTCSNFEIQGFKSFDNKNHIFEPIECKLNKKVEFRTELGDNVLGWKVRINKNDIIERGYSGSPLICKDNGGVIGVMSSKVGSKDGFAISIENLKSIWRDIPKDLIQKEKSVSKVFIRTSHNQNDIFIAKKINKNLNALGYKTFLAEEDSLIREESLTIMYEELKKCQYFVFLLSKESLESDMLYEEIVKIKELQSTSLFPVLLPIRINLPLDYNINYSLFRLIGNIPHLSWEKEEDTQTIINKIFALISKNKPISETLKTLTLKKTDIPLPNAPLLILEQPTGTVLLDSKFYVERVDDKECYGHLVESHTLIKIKAPRQYGKTSLLSRIILKAQEKKYNVVSFNFQEFDKSLLMNLNDLLEFIYKMIILELDIRINLDEDFLKLMTPKIKARKYIEEIVSILDKPLVLVIDEADRLFEYSEVSDEFFGFIRALHERFKINANGEKLKILLSHSTEAVLGTTSMNQSPFYNVGLDVELKPFTRNEIINLSLKHNIELSSSELNKFMEFVGGHPYLSRRILYTMVKEKYNIDEIIKNAYNEKSIFSDHLKRYLWILKDKDELKKLLKAILKGNLYGDDYSYYILEATGLIKNTFNNPQFSCELYKEFFKRRL